MISLLLGRIELRTDKFVIINVSGVGYRVYVTALFLSKLRKDQEAKLFTYQHVRENISELYGFSNFSELSFFETLISVSGIGPKAGLSIMALSSVEELKQAIASGQKSILTKVSGIGPKTAERLILELKDKVFAVVEDVQKLSSDSEVIDALLSLGYNQGQARGALKLVPAKIKGVEARTKEALKALGK